MNKRIRAFPSEAPNHRVAGLLLEHVGFQAPKNLFSRWPRRLRGRRRTGLVTGDRERASRAA